MLSIHQCTGVLHPTLTPSAAGNCNCSPLYSRIHVTSATSLVMDVNHLEFPLLTNTRKITPCSVPFMQGSVRVRVSVSVCISCLYFLQGASIQYQAVDQYPASKAYASTHILCGFSEGVVSCETLYWTPKSLGIAVDCPGRSVFLFLS